MQNGSPFVSFNDWRNARMASSPPPLPTQQPDKYWFLEDWERYAECREAFGGGNPAFHQIWKCDNHRALDGRWIKPIGPDLSEGDSFRIDVSDPYSTCNYSMTVSSVQNCYITFHCTIADGDEYYDHELYWDFEKNVFCIA